jgi:predicted metalloendopeptidase
VGEFFSTNGVAAPTQFSLSNPGFFETLNGMLKDTAIADWQAYLRFHEIDSAAPFLSKAFVDQNFTYGTSCAASWSRSRAGSVCSTPSMARLVRRSASCT